MLFFKKKKLLKKKISLEYIYKNGGGCFRRTNR